MAYIYKITNILNGKSYIGKTNLTIEERFSQHKSDSVHRQRQKRPLYTAMNKYGFDKFIIETIEQVSSDLASQRQIFWINYYNTHKNGYNATFGGDGKQLFNYKKIAEKYKEIQSQKLTAQYFGCCIDTVRAACKEYSIKTNIQRNKRPIYVISKDGKRSQFDSVYQAACVISPERPVRIARNTIAQAIKNNRTAYGYEVGYL